MNYLMHILLVIGDGVFLLVLLLLSGYIEITNNKPQDYLRCPYFYILIMVNELIRLTVINRILAIILVFISFKAFVIMIKKHLNRI